ncbi:carboxymuconolactone decarboxylase family protein [Kroppenstedtia pulmonis]|uniref:Carboxymuconolactone decarboxylase family protein n=1 Tax=Kroppenstedtia pulmonis TaxID=1380685 RepID=A0A7D4BNZ7_9BACL|nr:carboxymuconolactone decarboxylase family protein [Kroppenstedtia pulmonis]
MNGVEDSPIQQFLQEYKEGVGQFEKYLPEAGRGYRRFTEACFKKGELSVMHKHLIGVALAAMTNDEYCMVYHTKGAVDQGATDRQVFEAAAIAGAFGGGVVISQAVTLLQDSLQEFRKTGSSAQGMKH